MFSLFTIDLTLTNVFQRCIKDISGRKDSRTSCGGRIHFVHVWRKGLKKTLHYNNQYYLSQHRLTIIILDHFINIIVFYIAEQSNNLLTLPDLDSLPECFFLLL